MLGIVWARSGPGSPDGTPEKPGFCRTEQACLFRTTGATPNRKSKI